MTAQYFLEQQPLFATPWGSAITLTNVKFSNPYATVAGGNPFPGRFRRNMNFLANGALINDKLDHTALPTFSQ